MDTVEELSTEIVEVEGIRQYEAIARRDLVEVSVRIRDEAAHSARPLAQPNGDVNPRRIDGGAHGIPALACELVDIALPCDASPASEFQSSNDSFFPLLALPGAQARRAKIRNIGYGVRSDFELNFDRYLPSLGRADDDTDAKPE